MIGQWGLAAVFALVLSSMGMSSPVFAEAPQRVADQLKGAVAEFVRLAHELRERGDMPRLSDPTAAAILGRIWTADDRIGSQALGSADLTALGQIQSDQLKVLDDYLYFPAVSSQPIDFDKISGLFQDELTSAFVASVQASAKTSRVSEAMMRSLAASPLPHAEDYVQAMRSVSLNLLINSQKFISSKVTRAGNIVRIGRAFADKGHDFTLMFSAWDRKGIAAMLTPTVTTLDPASRAAFDTFIGALSDTPCGTLCGVP